MLRHLGIKCPPGLRRRPILEAQGTWAAVLLLALGKVGNDDACCAEAVAAMEAAE